MATRANLGARFGYNLIGFITGNFGLASAARSTARVLHRRQQPMRLVDIDAGGDRSGKDLSCIHLGVQTRDPVPFAVNLFHMNPGEVGTLLPNAPGLRVAERINLCVPFWELTKLPKPWEAPLRYMDLVLAPTQFIADVLADCMPDLPVLLYPQTAILPDGVQAGRKRWGLPENAVVYVNAFDINSDVNRKNPLAVIEAFKMAFPKPDRQYLVVKMSAVPSARALLADKVRQVHEAVQSHENVILIDELLPYTDVLSLYASSDVLVSLHRAEGLGLNLMEAMTFGKPVVATAWSGNMDFTNDGNSLLVDYELIPVEPTHHDYHPDNLMGEARWAEPDVVQAAGHMRRLYEDEKLRKVLGDQAQADMQERRKRFWRGLTFDLVKQMVLTGSSALWRRRLQSPEHESRIPE